MSVTCTRDYSITVISGCPDWNSLTWPAVWGGAVAGDGVRATFPNVPGPQFIAATSATIMPPGSATAFNFAGGVWSKVIGYAGAACNCNLHLIFSKAGSVTGGIVVVEEKTLTVLINFQFNVSLSGTYDLPFAVPDSLGVPYDIRVEVTLQCVGGPGPETINVNGTFSNI